VLARILVALSIALSLSSTTAQSAARSQASGSALWRGSISIKRRVFELLVESSLQGVALKLPPPLGKTADEALPMRIARTNSVQSESLRRFQVQRLPPRGDAIMLSVGRTLNGVIVRARDGERMVVERGALGLNAQAPALERPGIVVAGSLPYLDLDRWRALFGAGEGAGLATTAIPLTALNLVLQIFVDIRFPITHRDHSRLCLSQALCHPLTRPLPLETLLLRVAPLPAPMPLPALTQRPTPALLLDQSQRPPAVCHQQQYRVHQIPTLPACRRSAQIPQLLHHPVAIGQRRRVFHRQHIPDARRCPPRRRLKSPLPYGFRLLDDGEYVRQRTGFNFANADLGVELGLEPGPLSLALAVSNGTQGAAENNNAKQLSALVSLVFRDLRVGASASRNVGPAGRRDLIGGFGGFRLGRLALLGEADLIVDDPPPGRRGDQFAAFIEGNLLVAQGVNAKVSYGYLDPDRDIGENARIRLRFGGELFAIQFLQLSVFYTLLNDIPQARTDRDRLSLELHAFF